MTFAPQFALDGPLVVVAHEMSDAAVLKRYPQACIVAQRYVPEFVVAAHTLVWQRVLRRWKWRH